MGTSARFVNASPTRLMGYQDFRERLIDYTRGIMADMFRAAFAGSGVFNGTPIAITAFADDAFQLSPDALTADAVGHFLTTDAMLAGRDG